MEQKFANLLRETRLRKEISLRKLAKAVGMSVVYISDLEHGMRQAPRTKLVLKIAEELQTDPVPLLQAAFHDRKRLELGLGGENGATRTVSGKAEVALSLARSWDDLDSNTFEQLKNVLADFERRQGGDE